MDELFCCFPGFLAFHPFKHLLAAGMRNRQMGSETFICLYSVFSTF